MSETSLQWIASYSWRNAYWLLGWQNRIILSFLSPTRFSVVEGDRLKNALFTTANPSCSKSEWSQRSLCHFHVLIDVPFTRVWKGLLTHFDKRVANESIQGSQKEENGYSPESFMETKTISGRCPSRRRVPAVGHLSGNRLQICP